MRTLRPILKAETYTKYELGLAAFFVYHKQEQPIFQTMWQVI